MKASRSRWMAWTAGVAAAALLFGASAASALDRDAAARALGYASEAYGGPRCPEQRDAANRLSDDILAYWHFTAEDWEGRTPLGRLVEAGRATARRETRAACLRLEARLAQLRQEVLPGR